MNEAERIADNLATAFLGGSQTSSGLVQRGALACGDDGAWLRSLARRALNVWRESPLPLLAAIRTTILNHRGFQEAVQAGRATVRQYFWLPCAMTEVVGAPAGWQVLSLPTVNSLAEWLNLQAGHLDWFADCQGREVQTVPGPLRHYTYYWLSTSSGKVRLLKNT